MKRLSSATSVNIFFFLILFLLRTAPFFAHTYKIRATNAAIKKPPQTGYWSNWGKCNVLDVINLNSDIETIYSKVTQEYDLAGFLSDNERNLDGVVTTKSLCVDTNGTRCQMYLRTQSNGALPLYVDNRYVSFINNVESRKQI